jgi:hypothetical protein
MTDFSLDPQTSVGEVRIGEYYFPVVGGNVSQINLARWPPKVTFGDYTLDSDPLVSAWILSSFAGGIGNLKIKPGVEDDTYWTGTLESRYPDGLTLLPLTESFGVDTDPNSAFPLGDFPAESPSFLVAFDDALYLWDSTNQEFDLQVDPLPAAPVYKGVEWEGNFYVPHGANGYSIIDNTFAVTPMTDIEPIQFVVWDKKLCALTHDGELFVMPVGGAWTTSDPERTVPSGNLARRLVNFIDQAGNPTLHVITNSMVFAYDPDAGTGGRLYETKLDYPKHPNQGRAAVNWRGDTMFVNVGLGIHGYNGTNITAMGPDGRFGLPARLRGTVVDLAAEYNALLALIEGTPDASAEDAPETYKLKNPIYQGKYNWKIPNFPYRPSFSSLYRWSNSQWHPMWESPSASGTPTWMSLSEADGEYRLWWGYGSLMYTQELPVAFQNPKQSLLSGGKRFAASGSLITGWFDADMVAFHKLGSHIEVNLDDVLGTSEPGGRVVISYQLDNDSETSWKALGEANTVGLTVMTFRNVLRAVGDPLSKGRAFRRIRFKVDMYQRASADPVADQFLSPLLESIVFKFQKIPESQLSWQFAIDLTTLEGMKGIGNETLRAYLDGLLSSDEFFEFGIGNEIYRARAAQVSNGRFTGYDDRGNMQVNIVEVHHGPYGTSNHSFVDMDTSSA